MVQAKGVGGGDCRRSSRPPAADKDHSVSGFIDAHRREEEADFPGIEKEARFLRPFRELQAQGKRFELPAGLEDGDIEPALELESGGRAARAAPDDDDPLHRSPAGNSNRARQHGRSSVIRSENSSRPPPASPDRIPSSRAEMNPHVRDV